MIIEENNFHVERITVVQVHFVSFVPRVRGHFYGFGLSKYRGLGGEDEKFVYSLKGLSKADTMATARRKGNAEVCVVRTAFSTSMVGWPQF